MKYSILRHLLEHGISCTVCWMMTPNDCTRQGAQRGYLRKPNTYRGFDPAVFDYLQEQEGNELPDIHTMERAGPIARCRFYWAPFPSDPTDRDRYFAGCLDEAVNTDLVFLDPDIGPMPVKSIPNDLEKYVQWDEITRIYCAGHSVMVFNFLRGGTGQKNRLVADRCELLQGILPTAYVTVIRTGDLAFYLAVHQGHRKAVDSAVTALIEDWEDLPLCQVKCDKSTS